MNPFFVLPEAALGWVDYIATWIGFSTVVGLISSWIVLGRNQPNSILTILLGFAGTIIGWAIARVYFPTPKGLPDTRTWREELLSPATFLIGVIGTVALLFLYKLIARHLSKSKA